MVVPPSSPTLPPIYDGLDVSVTSIFVTWFFLNRDMASRRIYKLSFTNSTPLHEEYAS